MNAECKMQNERRLIDANALYEKATRAWDDTLCDECYTEIINLIDEAPTVDAVEVEDKKLLKAIKLLIKQYAHSIASDYVHSPVAHALFHTWKQVEEKRGDG